MEEIVKQIRIDKKQAGKLLNDMDKVKEFVVFYYTNLAVFLYLSYGMPYEVFQDEMEKLDLGLLDQLGVSLHNINRKAIWGF